MGSREIISILLRQSSISKFINLKTTSKEQNTALHICAKYGFVDCLSLLLHNEASTQITNIQGQTAVHLSVISGNYNCGALIVEKANQLHLPSPVLLKDNYGKNPLQYCSVEDSFILKQNTCDYYDIVLVFSADQTILGDQLVSFLESKKINVWYNKSSSFSVSDVLQFIDKSRGIIFIVGSSTVQEGSDEREILIGANERKKNIFPIWYEKIDLTPEMESIIFRYQLVDFTDISQFTIQGNILSVAIKSSLLIFPSESDHDGDRDDDDDDHVDDDNILNVGINLQDSHHASFEDQTLFLSYVPADTHIATTLLDYFDMNGEIQVFDSVACNDRSVITNTARHCFAVLLIFSSNSMNSIELRDHMSVAENNKKPLYALQVGRYI